MSKAVTSFQSPLETAATSEQFNRYIAEFIYTPATTLGTSGPVRRSPRLQSPSSVSPSRRDGSIAKRKSSGRIGSTSLKSPSRKTRPSSGYASPATYAHLPPLPDVIEADLICLFVGLNPGIRTSTSGHAYSHPSNLFWKLLHKSGCTTRLCQPEEDQDLPRLFALGNTNIVPRPTRNGSELSKAEMDEGVAVLEAKIRTYRPEAVAVVGKSIWESIWRVRHGRAITKDEFHYGWQDDSARMGRGAQGDADDSANHWNGALVFVASSTSGLAASLLPAEKERIWRELGQWVEQRRAERAINHATV